MTTFSSAEIDGSKLRWALGHYPTGVTLVTASGLDAASLGLVIGTFTAVSLDPPLIGFLPNTQGTTWPQIQEVGEFTINVLAAGQEQVCRDFVSKVDERFESHCEGAPDWPHPRVAGAVMWVDCTLEGVLPAGDHHMVLGRVRQVEVPPNPGLPLLFLRGGYGAPELATLEARAPEFAPQLRFADRVRSEAESISRTLDVECLVGAAIGDSVVSLAAAGLGGREHRSDTRVGVAVPLAAPLAPVFVAWGSPAQQDAWVARGQSLVQVDPDIARAELEAVRTCGYELTRGVPIPHVMGPATEGEVSDQALEFVRALSKRGKSTAGTDSQNFEGVTSIAAPILDSTGDVVLAFHLVGLSGQDSSSRVRDLLSCLLEGARRASETLGHQPG